MADFYGQGPIAFPSGTGVVDTQANLVPGTRAKDSQGNEYIYLKGAASTVAGDWVTFNSATWATTRLVADASGPVAVAMAAVNATTSYGWYQIWGYCVTANMAATTTLAAGLYIANSSASAKTSYVVGDQIHGAMLMTSSTATDTPGSVFLAFPYVNNVTDS